MEVVVEFALVHELWMFGVGGFELDGHLQVGLAVETLVDLSECTLIKFSDDFVVFANLVRYLRHDYQYLNRLS